MPSLVEGTGKHSSLVITRLAAARGIVLPIDDWTVVLLRRVSDQQDCQPAGY